MSIYTSLLAAKSTSGGGSTPTGSLDITANGTYDVTQYASANVNVSGGGDALTFTMHYYTNGSLQGTGSYAFDEGSTWSTFTNSDDYSIIGKCPLYYMHGWARVFYASGTDSVYLRSGDYNQEYVWKGEYGQAVMVKSNDLIDPNAYYYVEETYSEDCLVAGSMITVPGKKGAIDVMDVKVGTSVTTLDPETLALKSAKVGELHIKPKGHEYAKAWYRFKFDDNTELHLTGKHRFYNVETGKFEWLQDFKVGDRAYKIDGTMPKLVSVEKIDEDVEWNSFWNENKECYFVDGFLSGNITSPVPNIKG